MKKCALLAAVAVFLLCSFTASAAGSYPVTVPGGNVYLKSSTTAGRITLEFSRYGTGFPMAQRQFFFMVPASAVSAGDLLAFDAPCSYKAAFFWSSRDLSSMDWPSNTYKAYILYASDFKVLAGSLSASVSSSTLSYPQGTAFFDPGEARSSGYYYISGILDENYKDLASLMLSVGPEPTPTPEPTPVPTQEPTPEPTAEPTREPTPAPTAPPFSGISGPSESLGTFGTLEGTQTEAYQAFKRLYDRLLGIMTDDSVPSPPPAGYFPQPGASGSHAAAYAADGPVGYAAGDAADYDAQQVKASALVDQWLVRDGQTAAVDESWNLSPYSVEVAETGATLEQGYRDGNTYILHYRLRLPVRFSYIGHTGSGLASPQIIAGLSIDYEGDPAGSFLHSFGTPSVSLVQDASYDLLCTLGFRDGGLSGDVGAAFNNIPVLDWAAETSYEILVDFPLYISALSSPTVFPNSFQYEVTVTLEDLELSNLEFIHVSDQASSSVLEDIAEEQKKQHELENERYEQEQETIKEANGTASDGLAAVTETLGSWEIFVMPVTVTKDFITAITSSSSAKLTFPSFSLMGQTLWPSYTFDLGKVAELFPLLCNSLHLISGILVVIWFLRYLWRKWAIITGDDLPDGEVR